MMNNDPFSHEPRPPTSLFKSVGASQLVVCFQRSRLPTLTSSLLPHYASLPLCITNLRVAIEMPPPEAKKILAPANAWRCCNCEEVNLKALHIACPKCNQRRCDLCKLVFLRQRNPSKNEDRRPPN